MTIDATYNNDLSRVQLALSGMPDGTVQVQRVINASATEALWARGVVRGGHALPIDGGVGALDDFEFAADVANFYRTVPIDPPAGLLVDGTSGSGASTPDDPTLDITGDIDLRAYARSDDWSVSTQVLTAKRNSTAGEESWQFYVNASGNINFAWWNAAETLINVNGSNIKAVTGVDDGEFIALRVTLDVDDGAGNRVVRFFHAPTLAGPWTQLGADDTVPTGGGAATIFSSTAVVEVGGFDGGTSGKFVGTIAAVEVRNGIDGTVVANPDFAAQPGGTTGFTDSAGRTWTVNGTAQVVGIEQASITPSLAGQVWLKSIRYPALNRAVRLLDYGESIDRVSRSNVHPVVGQSPGVGMHDQRLGRQFVVHLITEGPDHLTEAGEWDIILTAATTWFIHTPADSTVPGGYVAIGETSQRPIHRGADSHVLFRLPCTIEKPPPPQFTGTLLTAETLFRLYGDWNALYAAHTTGRSMLATIADPSDVVVL